MTFGLSASTIGAIAAPVIGGLLGGSKSATSTGTTNTDTQRAPWIEAQPWIKSNLGIGQQLQNYYQQNPFNAQQQAGMNNTMTDADNFRNNILPGLLGMANNMSTQRYQRATGGAVGSGGGYGGPRVPGGLISGGQGPFNPNTQGQNFGLINFAGINPFSPQNQPPKG